MRFTDAKRLQKGDRVLCTYNDSDYLVTGIKIDEENKSVCVLCEDGFGRHHTMLRLISADDFYDDKANQWIFKGGITNE